MSGRNAEQAEEIEMYPAGLPWRDLMARLRPGEEVMLRLTPCNTRWLCTFCLRDYGQVKLSLVTVHNSMLHNYAAQQQKGTGLYTEHERPSPEGFQAVMGILHLGML